MPTFRRRATGVRVTANWDDVVMNAFADGVEMRLRRAPPCDCPNCRATRTPGEIVNGIEVQRHPDANTMLANGHIVHGYGPGWTDERIDEVLERAVRLACLAYPERMASFTCGMQL